MEFIKNVAIIFSALLVAILVILYACIRISGECAKAEDVHREKRGQRLGGY